MHTSYADYYPFGMQSDLGSLAEKPLKTKVPLRQMPGKFGGGNYRYAYQGKFAEKDDETGLLSFEARMYDARIGRWLKTDDKYKFTMSPYVGMGNSPIIHGDPDGRDIIVLLSSQSVGKLGHMAVITGNEGTGYWYYSKNGTAKNKGVFGTTNTTNPKGAKFSQHGEVHFDSLKEAIDYAQSKRNPVDEQHAYDKRFTIETSQEEDERARIAMNEQTEINYILGFDSCKDVPVDAVESALNIYQFRISIPQYQYNFIMLNIMSNHSSRWGGEYDMTTDLTGKAYTTIEDLNKFN